MSKPRAVVYTCTAEVEDETGIRAASQYAAKQGWDVVQVFEDLERWVDLDSETLPLGLSGVVEGVSRGDFERVVMLSPDRLGKQPDRFLASFLGLRWVGAEVAYVHAPDEGYQQLMQTVDRWLAEIALTPNTGRRRWSVAEFQRRDQES